MLLTSLAWSAYLVPVVSEGLTTKSCPMVEGTVISSNGLRIQHNQERYIIEVEYSYMVDGKLFLEIEYQTSTLCLIERSEIYNLTNIKRGIKLMFFITLRSLVNST